MKTNSPRLGSARLMVLLALAVPLVKLPAAVAAQTAQNNPPPVAAAAPTARPENIFIGVEGMTPAGFAPLAAAIPLAIGDTPHREIGGRRLYLFYSV